MLSTGPLLVAGDNEAALDKRAYIDASKCVAAPSGLGPTCPPIGPGDIRRGMRAIRPEHIFGTQPSASYVRR